MITTQELHNAVNILLQKSNTHWNKNFLPQEIDWFLNNEIQRFIKQRLNTLSNDKQQSMFDIMKRVQDLNSLEETIIVDGIQNTDNIIFPLPRNFEFYISATSYVSCTDNIQQIVYNIYNFDLITILNPSSLVISATLPTFGTVALFSLSDLPTDYLPQDDIPTYQKSFILNNAILQIIKKKLDTYYNQQTSSAYIATSYKNLNNITEISFNKSLNKFEISGTITSLTIVLNGNNVTPTTTVKDYYLNKTSITGYKKGEVRIESEEFKREAINSYLSRPSDRSIMAYLRQFWLEVPKVSGVIIHSLEISYLRKPRIIDLLLNNNSELPDIMLDEIVAKTAETMLGVISSDTYEKYRAENTLIE